MSRYPLNLVVIEGVIAGDPEHRSITIKSQEPPKSVSSFWLDVDDGSSGSPRTSRLACEAWQAASQDVQHVRSGQRVVIEGRIRVRDAFQQEPQRTIVLCNKISLVGAAIDHDGSDVRQLDRPFTRVRCPTTSLG